MGIVVIGAIFVDIKGYPLTNYIPGGRNTGRIEQVHGGVCRNVAEDIANVELRPTLVSLVDDTGIGDDVLRKLKRHKVCTDYIRVIKDGMGTWLAIFDNDGDVVASISKRPNLMPILDTLQKYGDEIFSDADSIIIEFDIDREILKQVFAYGKKYGKKIYAVISNMSIAVERRDLLKETSCLVCNKQEAGILFSEEWDDLENKKLEDHLVEKITRAQIPQMVVTLGADGAVYGSIDGDRGYVPAQKVHVKDTTGAGDAFFAGVTMGLTYGKDLKESCEIGTRLAASVIGTMDSVCPRFLPGEFGLEAAAE